MSKSGKRLIAALQEVCDALKCEHEWEASVDGEYLVKHCHKCGISERIRVGKIKAIQRGEG